MFVFITNTGLQGSDSIIWHKYWYNMKTVCITVDSTVVNFHLVPWDWNDQQPFWRRLFPQPSMTFCFAMPGSKCRKLDFPNIWIEAKPGQLDVQQCTNFNSVFILGILNIFLLVCQCMCIKLCIACVVFLENKILLHNIRTTCIFKIYFSGANICVHDELFLASNSYSSFLCPWVFLSQRESGCLMAITSMPRLAGQASPHSVCTFSTAWDKPPTLWADLSFTVISPSCPSFSLYTAHVLNFFFFCFQ